MNSDKMMSKSSTNEKIHALVSLTEKIENAELFFEKYECDVEDKIGRIYIVSIPIMRVLEMTADPLIERIEAERMPRISMDVSPGQVNTNGVYASENLPQAFTGKGVVCGVFDCYYDFTHPSFRDEEGNSRIKYYYDFLWKNEDGSMGYAIENPDEILNLKHSRNVINHTHGSHVAGIMAGSPVNGSYQDMAPNSDIYLVDFNSMREDFENTHTSATAVLGFKYIFDKAEEEGKSCVINFSSCESIILTRQRILEGEALEELVGPGRIIVAACGNSGHLSPYMEKSNDERNAGVGITNGLGGGHLIDMDIITPGNQTVRFDFMGYKLVDPQIEATIKFNTDSVKALAGDTCYFKATVSMGDLELKVFKSNHYDERGDVFHVEGNMPNTGYLIFCGATCLLTGDSPAWMYTDIFYSPFSNIESIPEFSNAIYNYSVS